MGQSKGENMEFSLDNIQMDLVQDEEVQDEVTTDETQNESQEETQEENIDNSQENTDDTSDDISEELSDDSLPEEDKELLENEESQDDTLEETDKDKSEEANDSEVETPLHLHAALMKDRGLLPSSFNVDEVEGDTTEDKLEALADAIEKGYEERYNSLKGSLDSLSKEVLDKINSGLSEEEAKQSVVDRAKIENLDDETLEGDDDLQEKITRMYLQETGMPQKSIDRYIKNAKNSDSLYEEAKDARQELPEMYKQKDKEKQEQVKQQQKEREKKREDTVKQIDQTLDNYVGKELYPGVKLNKNDAKKVKDILLNPAEYVEQNGQQVPISYEAKLKRDNPVEYYIRWANLVNLGYFDPNADLSKIKKKQETSYTKKMSDMINKQNEKQRKSVGHNKDQATNKDSSVTLPNFSQFGLK